MFVFLSKGIQTSREADIAFDRKLKPLEELMSKQRDLYREEEKTMQVCCKYLLLFVYFVCWGVCLFVYLMIFL